MKTHAGKKVKISERAMVQRINRALAKEDQKLRKGRGRWASDLGEYYVVDIRQNAVVASNVDVGKLAKDLGCLAGYEEVEG